MLNENKFKQIILDDGDCILFKYNGIESGCEFITKDGKRVYKLWVGDKLKEFDSIDDLIAFKWFDGKTIIEHINKTRYETI